ncbi:hypothetical protein L228DRAFT_247228 [Xylona heveae TC161]|uniref:Uncharacterized protein n=1 Tax=Xylona heveae (strain CBS 132557 / TC161) TaxID=1328760 RepID=A0A165H0F3_XYLHT|nr:hypothetical protein L228DRAFT_247228 [Xylona heveae TC161]KZF22831.1 hypothetical protein L228DRAFT_247228 [Xylona heveae TC161]
MCDSQDYLSGKRDVHTSIGAEVMDETTENTEVNNVGVDTNTYNDSDFDDPFSWSIPLDIEKVQERRHGIFLGPKGPKSVSSPFVSPVIVGPSGPVDSVPLAVMVDEVRSTRVQAKLERPLQLGTFNGLTAVLLRFHLTFQRTSDSWMHRIRKARVTITFEDAPIDQSMASNAHPSVVKFYPKLYEGPVSTASIEHTLEASAQAASMPGIASAGAGYNRKKALTKENRLVIHGVTYGEPAATIVFTIKENEISKSGMPRQIDLALIVNTLSGKRFSASVEILADYGFRSGALGMPARGKNLRPVFIDPEGLRQMAKDGKRGVDGALIVTEASSLDNFALDTYSSLPY